MIVIGVLNQLSYRFTQESTTLLHQGPSAGDGIEGAPRKFRRGRKPGPNHRKFQPYFMSCIY